MIYGSITVLVCVGIYACVQGSPLLTNDHNGIEIGEERLGIIVSPVIGWFTRRQISIYWNITRLQEGDKLILYNGEPEASDTDAIFTFKPTKFWGVKKTHTSGRYIPSEELTFEDRCLDYYVAWVRNGKKLKVTCLATHPNWMRERKSTLGSKRLNQIYIPGTHDSASYEKDGSLFQNTVDKYTITQNDDILGQLIYGVRYLDIRVGRYEDDDDYMWWANHDIFNIHPLITIINDVKKFLNNTQEIVIFDVQEFPIGFEENAFAKHNELVAYLEEQFADYYLPKYNKAWAMTLDEIWATGRRLIIGYDNGNIYPRHESTWPAVSHAWPRANNLNDLYEMLEGFESSQSYYWPEQSPTSVMAELTPDTMDFVLNRLGGLRLMAESVNMNVTESYNANWGCRANIVSMDYIKSSGIIESALEWNDKRPSMC